MINTKYGFSLYSHSDFSMHIQNEPWSLAHADFSLLKCLYVQFRFFCGPMFVSNAHEHADYLFRFVWCPFCLVAVVYDQNSYHADFTKYADFSFFIIELHD